MKKNRTTKIAGFLLAGVLATSCFVGGTFAKYTSSDEGEDSARVAKFGVVVTANGGTFANKYNKDDETFTDSDFSVESEVDVVAPGTKGDMASMTLSGKPEVAVSVTYGADLELGDKWMVDGTFYCPIIFTVNKQDISSAGCTTADDFEERVESVINGYSKNYVAGEDLSTKGNDSVSVSWRWDFSGNNDKDTALGNADSDVTVGLTIGTTVTQID